MPRADDPRVVIRLTPEDHAAIKAAADIGNIAVGALVRECAIRYCSTVAADVRRGSTRLRRAKAVEAVRGQVQPASSIVRAPAEDWMAERQRRVNADRERSQPKAKR
jgi:uncharacterized protein (DUF1778 family)